MLAVVIAEGVAIVLLGVLVLGLLRSHALILKALHELGAGLELEKDAASGSAAPGPVSVDIESGVVANDRPEDSRAHEVIGTTLDGAERTVAVSGHRQRTLLAFLTSGCSVCQTFWEEFGDGVADVPGGADLVVVAKGTAEESPSTLRRLAGDRVPVVQSSAAWAAYDIPGSPYFVFVEDGVITGEGSATTWPQVRDLMAQAVADAAETRAAAGRPGPGSVGGADAATDAGAGFLDRGERDSLPRMDGELLASGIHPGHPSLYEAPDAGDAAAPHHDHEHAGHQHAEPGGHRHP
ncbi:MAG TPA: hypothetical protein VH915_10260 [Pedococcus sp.]|jgi:hypothetical protein